MRKVCKVPTLILEIFMYFENLKDPNLEIFMYFETFKIFTLTLGYLFIF